MKRIIALLLALLMMTGAACAELKLSSFSRVYAHVQENQPDELHLGKTRFSLKQLWQLKKALPEGADFTFTMTYCNRQVPHDATVVDMNAHSHSVKPEDLERLIELLPNVKKLIFSNHRTLRNKVVIPLLEKYPDIEFVWNISIASKYSVDSDATAFSCQKSLSDDSKALKSSDLEVLKYLPNLRALDLGHQNITSLDFLQYVPNLRILILADNRITDLSPIAQLTELEYLELFRNDCSDLSPLSGLDHLLDLNLCFLPLQDADLTVLDGLEKLERFWCNMSGVPEEMQERFLQAHPDTQAMFSGTRSTEDGWRKHTRYDQYRAMFKNYTWVPFE